MRTGRQINLDLHVRNAIARACSQRGVLQELAQRLGVSPSTVGRWRTQAQMSEEHYTKLIGELRQRGYLTVQNESRGDHAGLWIVVEEPNGERTFRQLPPGARVSVVDRLDVNWPQMGRQNNDSP